MSASDLSGQWQGIFSYPRDLPPATFTATIADHAGALIGEIEERARDGGLLTAMIEGERRGASVIFTKRYDRLHPHAIRYDGMVDADGTEIAGTWRIEGQWSGTFVMIRPARTAQSRRRTVRTPIDA